MHTVIIYWVPAHLFLYVGRSTVCWIPVAFPLHFPTPPFDTVLHQQHTRTGTAVKVTALNFHFPRCNYRSVYHYTFSLLSSACFSSSPLLFLLFFSIFFFWFFFLSFSSSFLYSSPNSSFTYFCSLFSFFFLFSLIFFSYFFLFFFLPLLLLLLLLLLLFSIPLLLVLHFLHLLLSLSFFSSLFLFCYFFFFSSSYFSPFLIPLLLLILVLHFLLALLLLFSILYSTFFSLLILHYTTLDTAQHNNSLPSAVRSVTLHHSSRPDVPLTVWLECDTQREYGGHQRTADCLRCMEVTPGRRGRRSTSARTQPQHQTTFLS